MKMRKDKNFISFFDEATGHYVRSGIIKNGVESAEDPFMACFPELLDVGIMGHCKHGQVGIVPNFTTSGLGLNFELAQLCKKHCGTVAVSWYRSSYTLRAIDLLLQAGVKTNIHYVVSNSTIEEASTRLKECSFPAGINAIVFLLHKPVGLGSQAQV